jgi:hypothetical protein
MKKTLLLFALSSFSVISYSQNTFVPDNNFEQALIDLGYDTAPLDDYVLTSNINTISNLNLFNKSITDLTGIEGFTALGMLDCSNNLLTAIDLSQNTALYDLICSQNNLISLDVSQNTNLSFLSCDNNQLQELNTTTNASLNMLTCSNNLLTSLNVKNGNNTAIYNFNATNNPNLFCIEVDDVAYSTSNWTDIDSQSNFSLYCNATYVPDDNFEQALIDLGYDTAPLDNYVLTSNINTLSFLNVSNKNIADLTGIEDFANLQDFYCDLNQLTSVDMSQNSLLSVFSIGRNQLTNIDVSQNSLLSYFNIEDNQLTSIDMSQNSLLSDFNIDINLLTTLDLSQNTALTGLVCSNNLLENLDVSSNVNLGYIYCQNNSLLSLNVKNGNNSNFVWFYAVGNPNLTCIQVDNESYSTANWSGDIDSTSSFSVDCSALSNESFNEQNIAIYPNPFKSNFKLSVVNDTSYEVIDVNGKLVLSGKLFSGENSINLSNETNGFYFIKLMDNENVFFKKLVKY